MLHCCAGVLFANAWAAFFCRQAYDEAGSKGRQVYEQGREDVEDLRDRGNAAYTDAKDRGQNVYEDARHEYERTKARGQEAYGDAKSRAHDTAESGKLQFMFNWNRLHAPAMSAYLV